MQKTFLNQLLTAAFITSAVLVGGCGDSGDRLEFSVESEGAAVGESIDFKLTRMVNQGTAYRDHAVENFVLKTDPPQAIQFDPEQRTMVFRLTGNIKVWAEADVEPTAEQQPYVDWTSKRLKSREMIVEVGQ